MFAFGLQGNGTYRVAADEVPDEWVGFFIEVQQRF